MEGPIMTIPGISFLSNLLKATPHRVNRDRDARKFASSFTTQYGSGFPAFFDGSYSRAVATAHRSSKFLLVYLHSSLHDDSDQFVHDVLGNSAIQALIDSHMLMWAGQVSDVEAYELATDLNVSAFPCLSVLVCHSEREVLQADNIEGQLDPETVKARLELSISEFTPQITRGREEALRRDFHYAFDDAKHGGVPDVHIVRLHDRAPFQAGQMTWHPLPIMHGTLPIHGFRVDDVAYLTDASAIGEATKHALQGLEILVLNALRPQPHYSHFSLPEALEVAAEVGAKRTYLTHVSHLMGRHAVVNEQLPKSVRLAHDGLTLVRQDAGWKEVPSGWFAKRVAP